MTRPTSVPSRLAGAALAVLLSLLPALLAPDRALGAPGDTDPVGVWPLAPVPRGGGRLRPPVLTLGRRSPGGRPARLGRAARAQRPARDGLLRRADRGAWRRGRRPRRHPHHLRAGLRDPSPSAPGSPAAPRSGTLELAGSHCFPRACLHWGWLRGETYLDPLGLVGAGPVRLLPLWRAEPVDPVSAAVDTVPLARWSAPVLPYASWRPAVREPPGGQARGCACW